MRIFLFPIPCASNQCISALRIVPSKRRTVALLLVSAIVLFRIASAERARFEFAVPIAMGSMSVIFPTISKCIRAHYVKHRQRNQASNSTCPSVGRP